MSNNPNWKRQLQDKINEHTRQHGSKPKGVSNKTMLERACSLFRSFTLLRRLGFQIDPNNLGGRHIRILVDYWTCNPRIADLCRQRGVTMLEGTVKLTWRWSMMSHEPIKASVFPSP